MVKNVFRPWRRQSFLALFVIPFLAVETVVTGDGKCRSANSNKLDSNQICIYCYFSNLKKKCMVIFKLKSSGKMGMFRQPTRASVSPWRVGITVHQQCPHSGPASSRESVTFLEIYRSKLFL